MPNTVELIQAAARRGVEESVETFMANTGLDLEGLQTFTDDYAARTGCSDLTVAVVGTLLQTGFHLEGGKGGGLNV